MASDTMVAEVRVNGRVPRCEMTEWRERYGLVAGITVRGTSAGPFDLGVVVSQQVHGTNIVWHQAARGMSIEAAADGQFWPRDWTCCRPREVVWKM